MIKSKISCQSDIINAVTSFTLQLIVLEHYQIKICHRFVYLSMFTSNYRRLSDQNLFDRKVGQSHLITLIQFIEIKIKINSIEK